MISCINCRSNQFLQITSSRITFSDGSNMSRVEEAFECQLCGNKGELKIWEEQNTRRTSITGGIESTDDEPRVSP